MDSVKPVLTLSFVVIGLVALLLGFKFISDHWTDIKELFTIALVLGGSFTVAIGGLKLRSGH
jgi:L-lactate permease